ncbi:hypothetical protein Hanom_Chr05g00433571 [Helianthus anomalus]
MVINIFFFVCFIIPIFRTKFGSLKSFKDYVFNNFRDGGVNLRRHKEDVRMLDLPTIRFEDLHNQGRNQRGVKRVR